MSAQSAVVSSSRRAAAVAILVAVGLGLAFSGARARASGSSAVPLYVLSGMNFSPYIDGQDPNSGLVVSSAQLQERLQLVAPYTRWVHTFSMTHGLENLPALAHAAGLKVAAGAWIGQSAAQNAIEIQNLIASAQAGEVDLAVVGSESLLRHDVTEAQLLSYINQVRSAIPANIPVGTADTYDVLLAHPGIMAASDVVLPNIYPFWQGVSISNAICATATAYGQVVAAANGKPVKIMEAGWPSAGNSIGAAVPSPENASTYFNQFVSWARQGDVAYFVFEALDESWKANYEGPVGAHWGVFDKNGVLKPGFQSVFDNQTVPVSCNGIPGGPGTPSIDFTYVPPYGSSHSLQGSALHASPASFNVVIYIYVPGFGWVVKPTLAQPLTSIQQDGSWASAIVTGGSDQLATQIAAFLIPNTYSPPLLVGAQTLPAELSANAAASKLVARTPGSLSGVVSDALGHPLPGAQLTLSGTDNLTTMSAPDGRYSFANVSAQGADTVTVSWPTYVFSPPSHTFNLTNANVMVNFVGTQTIDLSVALASSPTPVVGSLFTLTAIVRNAGPGAASNAVATITIPPSFAGIAVSTTRGTCGGVAPVVCTLGDLPRSSDATILINATPTVAGPFTLPASVSGLEPDSNPADNSQSVDINVAPPGPPPLIVDSFTGPNGTMLPLHAPDVNVPGGVWTMTGAGPTPVLTGNSAGIAAGTGHLQATLDVNAADVRIRAGVKVPSGNLFAGLAFRLIDANNHLLFAVYGDSLQLYRRQSGGYTLLASQVVGPVTAGTTHRLEVRATGSVIEGWWDDIERFSVVESFQKTATRQGLAWHSAFDPNTTFDNFEVWATAVQPQPPGLPSTPTPVNNAIGITIKPTLKWTSAGATSYDIAFGPQNPPPPAAAGLAAAEYAPPLLNAGTTYFWQVIAHNGAGSTPGPVWAFTTSTATADLLIVDSFTGANGTALAVHAPEVNNPGATWLSSGATPAPFLSGNTAGIAAGAGHLQTTLNVNASDVRVSTDVKVPSGNFFAGLAFRFVNANNHLLLVAYADSLQLLRRQGGQFTLLASQSVGPIAAGSTHRLEVHATGSTIEGWWDNVARLTVAEPFQQAATRHGLAWQSAYDPNTTFDNFEIRASGALPSPPGLPAAPSPADGAIAVTTAPTLTWSGTGATSYDVAFGTSYPPAPAVSGLSNAQYTPPALSSGTTYYWQVTAHNAGGGTVGPIWAFTTGGADASLLISDSFAGLDGTPLPAHPPDVNLTGATWTSTGATPMPALTNNTVGIVPGAGHLQATLDVNASDIRIAVDVNVQNGNFFAGLAFRLTNGDNHLLLAAYANSLQLYRKQSGRFTLLATQDVGPIASGTHRLEVHATGATIEAVWDNVQRFSISESFQQTATRHGLAWHSAFDPNTTFDNFEIRR